MLKNTQLIQDKIKEFMIKERRKIIFKLEILHQRGMLEMKIRGKHGKFENMWKGPFKIATFKGKMLIFLRIYLVN